MIFFFFKKREGRKKIKFELKLTQNSVTKVWNWIITSAMTGCPTHYIFFFLMGEKKKREKATWIANGWHILQNLHFYWKTSLAFKLHCNLVTLPGCAREKGKILHRKIYSLIEIIVWGFHLSSLAFKWHPFSFGKCGLENFIK